ncbi:hypothetical protein [Stenotrophomonas maltophilia]|uniref:hypothetical protein n=1 Tax=Stenotrophomonas maltophilia TaxID=40324 RepID=UPI0010947CD9|nr:hypothetical protein [Stenotrophomonas maltophilia]TGW19269.1 hypothetical protein E4417_10740 [Stenotrophomonas maltophilia]
MDGGRALMTLFALGISLVWILVPFAIFAVRNLLRELLAEQRRTNELLEHIGGYRIPKPQPKPTVWRAP